jgi:L-seryl-tRNA(Ser) seleniumtransferase
MGKQELLKQLPSVDEILRSEEAAGWLARYPRPYVVEAIRRTIDGQRKLVLSGNDSSISLTEMHLVIEETAKALASLHLHPVINATGIVIHTNLGRSPLSEGAVENISRIAGGYSNLEYDIPAGKRGKRYSHIRRSLREVTGAEDGFALNNNAGAVLLCLSALAKGREVIVSRGELVEIGGSFRVPDVMAQSGAVLREVGTTNKTHLRDYEAAINENTALILKVHQSNYRITGFTEDVSVAELTALGKNSNIPVMYDMGSGNLIDLGPWGIHDEPTVQEILRDGADLVSFSGDKLLGGPQAGIVVGRGDLIAHLQKQPLLRALRIDKLTLAALEATLKEYIEPESAKQNIPTLRMLLEDPAVTRKRARRLATMLKGLPAEIQVQEAVTYSGGGALPMHGFKTYVVAITPNNTSVPECEEALRTGQPTVVARIREDALLLDARTITPEVLKPLAERVREVLADN